MKKFSIVLIASLLIFSANANAQEPSWNKKMGDRYFQSYSFFEAIKKYEFIKNPDDETLRKLAQAYFYTGDYAKSESYYEKIMNLEGRSPEDIYKYASVLSVNEKYDLAEQWMTEYRKVASSSDKKALQYANKPDFYKALAQSKKNITTQNLSMNSKHTDFGAGFYKDKVVFTSSDPHGADLKKNWAWNDLPFLDLYIADTDTSLEFSNIEPLFEKNGKYHRGPATFNAKGDFMVFTGNSVTKSDIVRLKLYYSNLINGKWSDPQEMPFNGAEFSSGLASLTADGETIYFASDRPGTLGSSDLWVSHKSDGSWTEPENLGESINTGGRESFPFIHNDGTLFFVSDGLPGLGGLDIYTVPVLKFGEIDPENLGAPFNSSHDDFAFILSKDEMSGYFSSNRVGGKGDDDIYKFSVLIEEKTITGTAITLATGEKKTLGGVLVYLNDDAGNVVDSIITENDGSYSFVVEAKKTFVLAGSKTQYKDASSGVDTNTDEETIETELNLEFIPDLSIKYIVKNSETGKFIEGVVLKITDNISGKVEELTTESTGEYVKALLEAKLMDKVDYKIELQKKGFMPKTIDYAVQLSENKQYVLDMNLTELAIGKDYAMGDLMIQINFDYRSAKLDKDARFELDGFVKFMNDNPKMRIELSSHTDCRGTDIYNSKLSDKRAKASAQYIKTKITDPERLFGRGYGATKPLTTKSCGKLSEDEHRMNRRTEFRIISN